MGPLKDRLMWDIWKIIWGPLKDTCIWTFERICSGFWKIIIMGTFEIYGYLWKKHGNLWSVCERYMGTTEIFHYDETLEIKLTVHCYDAETFWSGLVWNCMWMWFTLWRSASHGSLKTFWWLSERESTIISTQWLRIEVSGIKATPSTYK